MAKNGAVGKCEIIKFPVTSGVERIALSAGIAFALLTGHDT